MGCSPRKSAFTTAEDSRGRFFSSTTHRPRAARHAAQRPGCAASGRICPQSSPLPPPCRCRPPRSSIRASFRGEAGGTGLRPFWRRRAATAVDALTGHQHRDGDFANNSACALDRGAPTRRTNQSPGTEPLADHVLGHGATPALASRSREMRTEVASPMNYTPYLVMRCTK